MPELTMGSLFDGIGVQNGNGCPAMGAGVVVADIDWRSATVAADGADTGGECGDFCRGQLPDKALFDHERRKGREAPMPLRAAVGDVAAGAHHVSALHQTALAARAIQVAGQRALGIVAMRVQVAEQIDHALRRHAQVLVAIEPDAVAGVAQVEFEHGAVVPADGLRLHRRAAGRAGGGARR